MGDLWNGNYLVNKHGHPTLIDPAIYYGSREVDIAMTKLFGGFPQKFYNSYNLEFPWLVIGRSDSIFGICIHF